jgi:NitT/TauT family transport system permease protein/taurine transport system permease protein
VKSWPVFLDALTVTIFEIGVAALIAITLGLLTGILGSTSALSSLLAGGFLASFFAVPLVILYPLLMAWVGIGTASKILFGVLTGFVPIALNALNGIRAVERRFVIMGRAVGANRFQLYTRIIIPFALPSIVSGLRIGIGLTVIGVLVAEMLASAAGIGYLITYYREMFETGHIYLGIILALLLAIGMNLALSRFERRFTGWQRGETRTTDSRKP